MSILFAKNGTPRAWWRLLVFYLTALASLAVVAAGMTKFSTGNLLGDYTAGGPPSWNLVLFGAVLAATAFGVTALTRRLIDRKPPLRSLGLTFGAAPKNLAAGFGLSVFFIGVTAAVITLSGGYVVALPPAATASVRRILPAALSLGFFALVEELLLRGYALKVLDETWGRYGAVGATSIVFSLLHVANPAITILALINVFLAGVILALLYLRSGSLWLAVGFHWGWNFIEGAVLGCAVSGIPAPGSILTTTAAGPPWLSGGPFGPEGSVVLTITASLAALLLILAKKSGPARVAAVSAE